MSYIFIAVTSAETGMFKKKCNYDKNVNQTLYFVYFILKFLLYFSNMPGRKKLNGLN